MTAPKSTPSFAPIDFDVARRAVDEHATRRIVPNSVYPSEVATLSVEGRGGAQPKPTRTPTRKFTVELPDYAIDAILDRALKTKPKSTARYVILEALQAIGIEIKPNDLVADGRRTA